MSRCSALSLFAIAALTQLGGAEPWSGVSPAPPHWFPFHVPSLPADSAGLIDRSSLTIRPAGADGPARIVDGRLVDGTGAPLRLFATNLTDHHVLPDAATGAATARRLRQLGFNAVRLHYADWTSAANGGLLASEGGDQPDPAMLVRLDRFAAELKANGIWIDLNLHVARWYPGQPGNFHMGKGIDRVHGPYLESQQRYAKALLDRINPYTKVRWADEPAVILVELNNENSALNYDLATWGALPDEFRLPLQGHWNTWLGHRYGTTDLLRRAWNPVVAPELGNADLLRDAGFSNLGGDWALDDPAVASLLRTVGPEALPGLAWNCPAAGPVAWSLQLHQRNVPAVHGQSYVLSGWVRGDRERTVRLRLMHQQEPWGTAASASIPLTTAWVRFQAGLQVDNPTQAALRLSFDLDNQPGSLSFAGLALRPGSIPGLNDGERVEDASVPLPRDDASRQRTADLYQFIADRELAGSRQLRDYLRHELRCDTLLIDTQVHYGSSAGLRRELAVGDVIDAHGYPAHPSYADGTRNWRAPRKSLSQPGELDRMGAWRVAGRPFTVTEFDLQPPNDCASESVVGLTVMASIQDWDGIFDYCWLGWSPGDWDPKRILHPFSTPGFAPQMVTLPGMATAYRLGLIPRHRRTTTIEIGPDHLKPQMRWDPLQLFAEDRLTALDAWRTAIALVPTDRPGPSRIIDPPPPLSETPAISDGGHVVMDRRDPQATSLTVAAPAVRIALGAIAGRTLALGDVTLSARGDADSPWATVTVVALDGKPIADSHQVLITTAGRSANRGWVMRDGAVVDWGAGPAVCEPMTGRITLPGDRWTVTALAGDGTALAPMPRHGDGFALSGQPTLWYLAERSAQ